MVSRLERCVCDAQRARSLPPRQGTRVRPTLMVVRVHATAGGAARPVVSSSPQLRILRLFPLASNVLASHRCQRSETSRTRDLVLAAQRILEGRCDVTGVHGDGMGGGG